MPTTTLTSLPKTSVQDTQDASRRTARQIAADVDPKWLPDRPMLNPGSWRTPQDDPLSDIYHADIRYDRGVRGSIFP
jgi:hypothetical protein